VNRVARVAVFTACLVTASAVSVWGDPTDRSASLAAYEQMASVLTNARCLNCHPVTSFPTQGDDEHRHSMNVMRGSDERGAPGMQCATCHGRSNNAASGVPGADEDWQLAPLSMGWQGLSRAELCNRLKDRTRNGGRTGAAVVDHLRTPLVMWAWNPGTDAHGVARTSPTLSYADFLRAAETWVTTGQACPSPGS
jgi:hypothetical protein